MFYDKVCLVQSHKGQLHRIFGIPTNCNILIESSLPLFFTNVRTEPINSFQTLLPCKMTMTMNATKKSYKSFEIKSKLKTLRSR